MSECYIKKQITKQKFLSFDFRECKITKCFIKKEVFFDVIKQCGLYNQTIYDNLDILKSVYTYLINLQIDTSKNIKENSPITYDGESCFEIDINIINDNIIIREIFCVCEKNDIKLHIEIDCGENYLIYKD